MTLQEELRETRKKAIEKEIAESVEKVKEIFRKLHSKARFQETHEIVVGWDSNGQLCLLDPNTGKLNDIIVAKCNKEEKYISISLFLETLHKEGIESEVLYNGTFRLWIEIG